MEIPEIEEPSWVANDVELQQLYRTGFESIKRFVIKNNGSRQQAEDIYHDAFIAVWRRIQTGGFMPGNRTEWNAYLYKAAKNKWIDYQRSGAYQSKQSLTNKLEQELVVKEDTEHEKEKNSYIDLVVAQVSHLNGRCRQILEMYYYKELSMREIGKILDITEATAKNSKYRCIEKLRSIINSIKQ